MAFSYVRDGLNLGHKAQIWCREVSEVREDHSKICVRDPKPGSHSRRILVHRGGWNMGVAGLIRVTECPQVAANSRELAVHVAAVYSPAHD